MFSSWLNPTSIFIGALAVSACAYLAAVYLAADAALVRDWGLQRAFRLRALAAGVLAGAIALGGVFVVNADNHRLFHSLLSGTALSAVIVSLLAGVAGLVFVLTGRFQQARFAAALAVACLVAGWALARWPTILPGLTVQQAAAGHDSLVWVVVSVLVGAVIVFPALALLFRLALAGRFRARETTPPQPAVVAPPAFKAGLLARLAIACAIAGVGLLNVADAAWAHAIGVFCLLAFIIAAFLAIVSSALAEG
jgi:cytochrome d ubiquinol oxidase subunit II